MPDLSTIEGMPAPGRCPKDGAIMILVKDKFGRPFWGCPNWPVCWGRRSLDRKERRLYYAVRRRDSAATNCGPGRPAGDLRQIGS